MVSNRGPIAFADDGGHRTATRGSGGLAAAVGDAARSRPVTWIATALTPADRDVAASAPSGAHREGELTIRLLSHPPGPYDLYYRRVAIEVLWFAHHAVAGAPPMLPQFDASFEHAWLHGYRRINNAFARAVAQEQARSPHAATLFHDFHLYGAPASVRARFPSAHLGHVLHVPWPAPDAWQILPRRVRREILSGLLASDAVVFHSDRWRRNFLAACTVDRAGDADDAGVRHACGRTLVAVRPLALDAAAVERLAASPAVDREAEQIAASRTGGLVVVVARTDPVKNVVRALLAFDLLLDRRPTLATRARLLLRLDPSRQDVAAYRENLALIEAQAARINATRGTPTWQPVTVDTADRLEASLAAYREYDVLFVNPICDGLNLVAKEGPLLNRRNGAVVLSEHAGAIDELREWVIPVNPLDVGGQADALWRALVMPEGERRARAGALKRHLRGRDAASWLDAVVADVEMARSRITM